MCNRIEAENRPVGVNLDHSDRLFCLYRNYTNQSIVRISEDNSEPFFTGRGKNKIRMGSSSIIPNLPKTRERAAKIAAEILSKKYYDLMNIIRNKKFLSEIFEIEKTEDEDKLFAALVKHYGELWLLRMKDMPSVIRGQW